MRRRIAVVTGGHLATCPRMVKAADALHEAGFHVRVISTRSTPWAARADHALHAQRGWRWEVIDYMRDSAPARWLITGARARAAQIVSRGFGRRVPSTMMAVAFSRPHVELLRAILREPQDLIYAGTGGALAAAAEAGRRSGTLYAVDFEDFHCGEHEGTAGGVARDAMAARVMMESARDAAFVTAGSGAIAAACDDRLGIAALPINNVFSLNAATDVPADERTGPLRLYWFSQTIGPLRGLEDVIRAAGRAGIDAEFHLRGAITADYARALSALQERAAARLKLVRHSLLPPGDMVDACRHFDVGVAVEPGHNPNNALSLSNKALTYPLASLALVLTDTPGQRPLGHDVGEGALLYSPGDVEGLAAGLARWGTDRAALRRAKQAARSAASRRWHWEHPSERGQLLAQVTRVCA